MSLPLAGKTIALAEGRQLEELVSLLQEEGATVLRCPMLAILDAPDEPSVRAWLDELLDDTFGLLILMTGEAVRRLAGFAERAGRLTEFITALNRMPLLSRGPKPVKALRELGVTAVPVNAAAPTTEGVIQTLRERDLQGLTVGVTLFGQDNPNLIDFLHQAGATARPVLSYVFAPAADDDRVAELIERLAAGDIAALVVTSSPQVDRIYDVASRRGLEEQLRTGLGKAKVAAIGPVAAEALRARSAPVDICPEQGWVMKNLVRRIAREL